ncbi:hypothetical protein pEaSNUABM54_00046 [Erwinia phage pEa_SNUABM_54]|nr:hypothetical protein pEaSNUABM54_00046 [Erwinia phage pEa_SNUABM_54]
MKASERRLLDIINNSNRMNLNAETVSFGSPRTSPERENNTWIEVSAYPGATIYDGLTTVRYNRQDSRSIGKRSVIELGILELAQAQDNIAAALTQLYDIPCDASELRVRTMMRLNDVQGIVVVDFINHPLVYGSLTARLTFGRAVLPIVLLKTNLTSFSESDVQVVDLNTALSTPTLSGFGTTDIQK